MLKIADRLAEHHEASPHNLHARVRDAGAPRYRSTLDVVRSLRPDDSMFCHSEATLRATCEAFVRGFPGQVLYALKANSTEDVIATVWNAGIRGFDVASPAEMEIVKAIAPEAELHYHNPVKSRTEIETAWTRHNVRHYAVDDPGELDKVCESAEPSPATEIMVRFRLPFSHAAHDFTTKFGTDIAGAARLAAIARDRGYRVGLTFHPGSQCLAPVGYAEHIRAAGEIARASGVALASLNVGGGFPVPYPKSPAPALERYFDTIRQARAAAFPEDAPALVAEPGRALVATSTSILTRVKHVRTGTGEIFINDGIYGAFMELTQWPVELPACVIPASVRPLEERTTAFVVYGPTCDPCDRLPDPVQLPCSIEEGDWIEFGMVGAYSAATVTRFNGYGTTATVAVDEVAGGVARA